MDSTFAMCSPCLRIGGATPTPEFGCCTFEQLWSQSPSLRSTDLSLMSSGRDSCQLLFEASGRMRLLLSSHFFLPYKQWLVNLCTVCLRFMQHCVCGYSFVEHMMWLFVMSNVAAVLGRFFFKSWQLTLLTSRWQLLAAVGWDLCWGDDGWRLIL